MKKATIFSFAFIALAFSVFAATLGTTWKINPEGVSVAIEVPGDDKSGTVGGMEAIINFDAKDLESSSFEVTLDVNTLDFGNKKLTNHLKSADFFEVETFPTMAFQSTSIEAASAGFIANGKLTIKGTTKEIAMPFLFDTKGKKKGTFSSDLELLASDYGLCKPGWKGDKVSIRIEVQVNK